MGEGMEGLGSVGVRREGKGMGRDGKGSGERRGR